MKIFPIKSYKNPRYPGKELFIKKPGLLEKFAPVSWKTKAAVAGALMAFVFFGGRYLLSETRNLVKLHRIAQKFSNEKDAETKPPTQVQLSAKPDAAYIVAPVFCHGDGIGAVGCIVTTPPTFISENSARCIIEEEFARENIFFDINDAKIQGEKQYSPIIYDSYFFDQELGMGKKFYKENTNIKKPLKIDGFNKELDLGYIFISSNDYEDMTAPGFGSSVMEWNTRELAMYMQDRMERMNKTNMAIFYDPISSVDTGGLGVNAMTLGTAGFVGEKLASMRSKELLRQQVRDFLSWAKQEGILDKLRREKQGDK